MPAILIVVCAGLLFVKLVLFSWMSMPFDKLVWATAIPVKGIYSICRGLFAIPPPLWGFAR
jgi:hypothetical protein